VFMAGRIVQVATPRELFERPATREVAAFVGDRPINLIELDTDSHDLPAPFDGFAIEGKDTPKRIVVGIRPETLEIDPKGALSGYVERLEYLGSEASVTFRLDENHILRVALDASQPLPSAGERVGLRVKTSAAHLFDAATGMRLQATLVPRNDTSKTADIGRTA